MSGHSKNLMEHVPAIVRNGDKPLTSDVGSVLATFLASQGVDPNVALGYLSGMRAYREQIEHKDSKVFKVVLRKVETFERRRKSGSVLGVKGQLIWDETNDKTGKVEQQSIDTTWLDYDGYDQDEQSFYIALAKTLFEVAEGAVGREVFLRKAFFEDVRDLPGGGDRVRFLAEIDVSNSSPKPAPAPARQERREESEREAPARSQQKGKVTVDDLLDHADDLKIRKFEEIGDDLLEELVKVLNDNLTVDDMLEDLAKVLRVKVSEVQDVLPADPKSPTDAAVVVADALVQ